MRRHVEVQRLSKVENSFCSLESLSGQGKCEVCPWLVLAGECTVACLCVWILELEALSPGPEQYCYCIWILSQQNPNPLQMQWLSRNFGGRQSRLEKRGISDILLFVSPRQLEMGNDSLSTAYMGLYAEAELFAQGLRWMRSILLHIQTTRSIQLFIQYRKKN